MANTKVISINEDGTVTVRAEHTVTEADLLNKLTLKAKATGANINAEASLPITTVEASRSATLTITEITPKESYGDGDTVYWTTQITNNGNITQTNGTLAVTGASITSGTGYTGTGASCTIPTLAPGASVTVNMSHMVGGADLDSETYSMSATYTATGVNVTKASAAVTIINAAPEISLKFEDYYTVGYTSQRYYITAVIENTVPKSKAENVVCTVTFPSDAFNAITSASYATSNIGTVSFEDRTVTLRIDELEHGTPARLVLSPNVTSGLEDASGKIIRATATADGGLSESTSTTISIRKAGRITSTNEWTGGGWTILGGGTRTWKINLTCDASATYTSARDCAVRFIIPEGIVPLTVSDVSTTVGSVVMESGEVRVNLGNFAQGATAVITVKITTEEDASGVSGTIQPHYMLDRGVYGHEANCNATYRRFIPKSQLLESSLTWAQLASRTPQESDIGKVREINFSSYGSYLFRVIDINHDVYGSSIAKYTFDCVDCVEARAMYNSSGTNVAWASSDMKTWMNGTLYNAFPSDVRSQMRNVTKYTRTTISGTGATPTASTSYLFLLSQIELKGTGTAGEGDQYAFWKDRPTTDKEWYKGLPNSNSNGAYWWTRSIIASTHFYYVLNGGLVSGTAITTTYGCSPCFAIG